MAVNGALTVPDDLIELGRIISAYGIRGWVKVQPHSAQAEVLRAAPIWWLCSPAPPSHFGAKVAAGATASSAWKPVMQAHAVRQVRPQGSTVVADLEGIADRDFAESMRGYTVHVSRKDFPAAHGDEYYWIDLVGCMVYGDAQPADDNQVLTTPAQASLAPVSHSQLIGQVTEVVDNGAHALLRVIRMQPASTVAEPVPMLDAKDKPIEVLIPFVAAHVQHVDIVARRIDTDWPLDF
jgi:16S rRNA processing protein RimM